MIPARKGHEMATAEFLVLLTVGLALATTALSANITAPNTRAQQPPVAADAARERVRELEEKLIPQAHVLLREHRRACDMRKRTIQPPDKAAARYEQRKDQPTSPAMAALMKECAPQTREHAARLTKLLDECVALGGCLGL